MMVPHHFEIFPLSLCRVSILKAMVQRGRAGGRLQTAEIRLISRVIRDAAELTWDEGQFERRKRAVQSVLNSGIADSFQDQAELYELLATEEKDDEIFKRHGWNKVNSGFRFFDTGTEMDSVSPSSDDEFLQSKGWNDVDSGFRIF